MNDDQRVNTIVCSSCGNQLAVVNSIFSGGVVYECMFKCTCGQTVEPEFRSKTPPEAWAAGQRWLQPQLS